MSYAVLHIMKASGSCTAIARHIERSTQPDNAHPELRHLNRDDFIKYPDGVDGAGESIQHRLDHAGLTLEDWQEPSPCPQCPAVV